MDLECVAASDDRAEQFQCVVSRPRVAYSDRAEIHVVVTSCHLHLLLAVV